MVKERGEEEEEGEWCPCNTLNDTVGMKQTAL
jgi:hypothetical protein